MPMLNSCCGSWSLKTGSIVSGVLGILIGALTLIYILVANVKMKTIVIDTLPPDVVKIILALNLIMTMLISALLIVGVLKRNKFMMLPWVILGIMLAIGALISVIYTTVIMFIGKHVLTGVIWLICGLIFVAIYTYLWFVVFSYYQLLQEEKGRGPYSRPQYQRH